MLKAVTESPLRCSHSIVSSENDGQRVLWQLGITDVFRRATGYVDVVYHAASFHSISIVIRTPQL